jgi:alanine-glyoxylate transaminase/serine-glyoxylate transaminase/serine-pyruvate transaminase
VCVRVNINFSHTFKSTGVLSDVKAIAETVKSISPETLVVVDGVCSVGSEEIRFDEWKLDIVISGSQKGLGVPPGLSIVVASPYAMQVFKDRKTPVPSYYSNWAKWLPSKYHLLKKKRKRGTGNEDNDDDD